MRQLQRVGWASVSMLLLCLGCSGGGGGKGNAPATEQTVENALSAFGVDTSPTPRVDDDQDPLPEDYAPFGTAHTFDRTDELVAVGVPFSPSSFAFDSTFAVVEEQPGAAGALSTQALFAPAAASTPWALSRGTTPGSLRAVAAGDVDDDGLDEIVVLGYSPGEGAWLRVFDDSDAQFAQSAPTALDLGEVPLSLALAVADFDGDGKGDAAVVSTTAEHARIAFYRRVDGGFAPDGDPVLLTPQVQGSTLEVDLAAGNLDYDASAELALVLNERYTSGGADAGSARWFVLDDAAAAHGLRGSGLVRGIANGAVRTAKLAGVTVGDVDGDGVDEVVLGGVTGLDPSHQCLYAYVLTALDDLKRGLKPLATRYADDVFRVDPSKTPHNLCDADDPLRIRKVHVRAFDLDGDGAAEVQLNQLTYEDLRSSGAFDQLPDPIPLEQLFGKVVDSQGTVDLAGTFDAGTSAFAAADFSGDRRGDVAFVSQLAAEPDAIRIYGSTTLPGQPTGEKWQQLAAVPLASLGGPPVRPLLLAADVDHDGMALRLSSGEHQVIFTEPVIIAALAAPPCSRTSGQALSACVTYFGSAVSDGQENEAAYNVKAGVLTGASTGTEGLFGIGLKAELTTTIQGEYTKKTSTAYSTTRKITYTTGPIEDSVVFTTIPYDEYTYTVLSHPDPSYVGQRIVIALPRAPIHILASRSFYNAHAVAGAPRIDDSVFAHVPGVPGSYPSATEKDDLLTRFGGLQTTVVDVGEGTGKTQVELNVFNQTKSTTAWGISETLTLKATAGVAIAGFTVGGGTTDSVQITHGEQAVYGGQVGNLPEAAYADGAYRFGLFTYVDDDFEQAFEVVNYWVE